jgi:hypothetical protein
LKELESLKPGTLLSTDACINASYLTIYSFISLSIEKEPLHYNKKYFCQVYELKVKNMLTNLEETIKAGGFVLDGGKFDNSSKKSYVYVLEGENKKELLEKMRRVAMCYDVLKVERGEDVVSSDGLVKENLKGENL